MRQAVNAWRNAVSKRTRIAYPKIPESEVTPECIWLNRRKFIRSAGTASIAALIGSNSVSGFSAVNDQLKFTPYLNGVAENADDALTPYDDVTSYNNFYEFGPNKDDPAKYAGAMVTDPWTVKVGGLVDKPGELHLEDILSSFDLEERIYRFRCVEAWSMVVPWIGFPLKDLLMRFQPKSEGEYIEFKTLYRPSQMRGTRSFTSTIEWPYREGLRIDEAMNPLTLLTVGLYGKVLPNQNGAPLRLIVPWKYGFKSIKSIVQINVVRKQPKTSWQTLAPHEYGFYSNVNPEVDHPRWSQRYERRLPSTLFNPNRIKTQLFNGYSELVSGLFKNMDLSKY